MENFVYQNPTRILFGRGQIAALATELPVDARVLLLAGGGSIKENGVHAQVVKALGTRTVKEFWGVEANPDYDTLMRAVEIVKAEKLDWILPVGGGSVLDGAKFVAAAALYPHDPWTILTERAARVTAALPIGAVLTLPATGSESNGASVVSRRAIKEKLAFISPHVFPRFSVLDPETTFSLPARQVANGIGDAFCHVIEQYLTFPAQAAVQDRFAEGILRTLVEIGPKTLANPTDYDTRANFVWAATTALNGWISVGVPQDWATHIIGHELTALHGIDHARTLAVVLPSLLQVERAAKRGKLLQYAERVWDLRTGNEDARIDAAIEKTRAFYESLGIKTRLADYDVPVAVAAEVSRRLAARGLSAFGDRGLITPAKVEQILRAAA
ncbi:MAG: iron-containing alcohol dehydrogenase [Candidatus Didemnitutus sp.]|nr:iron-containing alcohol dehydrogenase [Candidatus Didemnitutus sp.]